MSFKKSAVLIKTLNSRALIIKTPTKGTPIDTNSHWSVAWCGAVQIIPGSAAFGRFLEAWKSEPRGSRCLILQESGMKVDHWADMAVCPNSSSTNRGKPYPYMVILTLKGTRMIAMYGQSV